MSCHFVNWEYIICSNLSTSFKYRRLILYYIHLDCTYIYLLIHLSIMFKYYEVMIRLRSSITVIILFCRPCFITITIPNSSIYHITVIKLIVRMGKLKIVYTYSVRTKKRLNKWWTLYNTWIFFLYLKNARAPVELNTPYHHLKTQFCYKTMCYVGTYKFEM